MKIGENGGEIGGGEGDGDQNRGRRPFALRERGARYFRSGKLRVKALGDATGVTIRKSDESRGGRREGGGGDIKAPGFPS